MNLYKKPNLSIDYDEENQMLIQTWTGFSPSQLYREGIEKSLEITKERRPIRILINLLNGGVVKNEDTEWMLNYAVPIFLQNGMKYQGFIYPTNLFAQMTVKNFDAMTGGAYKANFFDDVEKAKAWLISND